MRRTLAALALAGLLLTACGDDSSGAGTPAPGSSASPESSSTSSPGTVAPGTPTAPEALQFRAPVVGGGELDMSTFAGQTVAFWFWAPT